ncbi:MAG: tetratricopeptide repeat protein [Deltaproteobacteria bacterium]|nr:tetratricopeptide repeat protein [Deltaproteobacteria bacterium]
MAVLRRIFFICYWKQLSLSFLLVLIAAQNVFAQDKEEEKSDATKEPDGDASEVAQPAPSSTTPGTESEPTDEMIDTLVLERKADLELLIRRTQDFRTIVDGIVRRDYRMRREFIDDSYQNRIIAEEELAENTRKTAIEYFEKFLEKYPSNPNYTPDAMYRLGELYYDDSFIRYQERLEEFAEAQDRGTAGEMDPPVKELDRTIQVFRELIAKYPDYRSIDGAYYVLGYCLNETGHEEEARLAWLSIVCANKYQYDAVKFAADKAAETDSKKERPSASLRTGGADDEAKPVFVDPFAACEPVSDNSRFFFESWWLVGNYHFDYDTTRFGVETSIAAYKRLVEDPSHKFYDKGLYKLAWSYFKADRYPEAIAAFAKVVDFSDKQKNAKGTGMRPEAIQYLAVCFFTEDWDMDMMPDSVSGVERMQDSALMPQDREWTREVYERLGDIYFDNEKNETAIDIWKLYIQKWPLDVQAPFVQEKIAIAYNKMRLFDEEIAARTVLDTFGPDSEWWKANADHPAEQNEVARMARDALLEAAYNRHRNAQSLRQRGLAAQDAELLERAIQEYNMAAEAYRKFIEQNPDTPDAYDISFSLAETLFWSGQHQAAKQEYIRVRDSNLDAKYRTDAAYMVIVCLEEIFKKQVADGSLVMREEPPEIAGDPLAPTPLPIPPIVLELMNEREAFIKDAKDHEEAAKFRYQSAQNYYRYGHWEDAKTRYAEIYTDYCKSDAMAYLSWQTMMNMAVDVDDLDEKERLALLQQERKCSAEGVEEIIGSGEAIDIDTVLGDVAMQRALDELKKCMADKDAAVCSKAGDALVAAVTKASEHPDADKALHNAALAYEIAQRFDTAMKLYERIVKEYPDSQFVGKCLFQQASAANNFFEYDKALENYRILADEPRFKDYENRVVSIYNSAYIMTNLQDYMDAIPYWERYSREEQDQEKSIEAAFNSADMYFRAKKWRKSVEAYGKFIRSYERNKKAGLFVVKASYRTSLSERKLQRKRMPTKTWQRTVDLYSRLVKEPGSMSAEYAAESHFLLIEEDMRKFEKFRIAGSQKVLDKKIKEGAEKVKDFEKRYREIQKYRRPEWSLAAEFRIGYAFEVYAKAILNIPLPPLDKKTQKLLKQLPPEDRELVMIEYEDKFRAAMEEYVAGAEAKAQAEYKIAVELARKGNISNDWTLLALERMNAYDPDNYPRQHNGVIEVEQSTLGAPPWASEVER